MTAQVHQGAIDVLGPVRRSADRASGQVLDGHRARADRAARPGRRSASSTRIMRDAGVRAFARPRRDAARRRGRRRLSRALDRQGRGARRATAARSTARVDEPKGDPGNTLVARRARGQGAAARRYRGGATAAEMRAHDRARRRASPTPPVVPAFLRAVGSRMPVRRLFCVSCAPFESSRKNRGHGEETTDADRGAARDGGRRDARRRHAGDGQEAQGAGPHDPRRSRAPASPPASPTRPTRRRRRDRRPRRRASAPTSCSRCARPSADELRADEARRRARRHAQSVRRATASQRAGRAPASPASRSRRRRARRARRAWTCCRRRPTSPATRR